MGAFPLSVALAALGGFTRMRAITYQNYLGNHTLIYSY